MNKQKPSTQFQDNLEYAVGDSNRLQDKMALVNHGREKIVNGDVQAGVELIDQAIDYAQQSQDQISVIRFTGLKGVSLLEADQYEEAKQTLQRAGQLADEAGELALKCDALANIGLLLAEIGDLSHGLKTTQEALIIAIEIKDTQRTMVHRGTMGNLYLALLDFEGAVQAFNEAFNFANELGDRKAQVGFLNNIGLVFFEAAKFERVVEFFSKVLPLARELQDKALEANALKYLVKANHELGRNKAVISFVQQAERVLDAKDDLDTRLTLADMGIMALLRECRYQEAIDVAWVALDAVGEQGEKKVRLTFMGYLADAYYGNDSLDEAIKLYEQALVLSVRIQEKEIEARILGRLGALYGDMAQIEQSNNYIIQALTLSERFEDFHTVGEQYYILAMNSTQLGQKQQATDYCKKAIEHFEMVDAHEFIKNCQNLC